MRSSTAIGRSTRGVRLTSRRNRGSEIVAFLSRNGSSFAISEPTTSRSDVATGGAFDRDSCPRNNRHIRADKQSRAVRWSSMTARECRSARTRVSRWVSCASYVSGESRFQSLEIRTGIR